MNARKIYQLLAVWVLSKNSSKLTLTRADDEIKLLMRDAPSGSGIDCGTKLDSSSTHKKLVFNFSFHHMDEHGFYDGWTNHQAIVTPDLGFGYSLRITGPNPNEIKEYFHDVFSNWLNSEAKSH